MAASASGVANEGRHSDSTASDLLAAAKRLEPRAWQELVDRYSWLVLRWCRQEGLDGDDARDVLQAVLLRVVQNLDRFEKDGQTAAFRRWLRTLTHSQVADFRRTAANQPRGHGGSSAQVRLSAVAEGGPRAAISPRIVSLLDRFWQLVDRLEETIEPSTWQAFWLTTFENLNSAEAAQMLRMTPAAVRMAKARVVRRIREEDAQLADELTNTRQ
jgi:RNA polymerase sigma-70 factor (ECF subfamily)